MSISAGQEASSPAITAREDARQDDGRFGEQGHARSDGVALPAYPVGMSTYRAYELSGDAAGLSDEDYNSTGSYDYPPVHRSANQVRLFWATTEIPDEAVAHYEQVYTEDALGERNAKLAEWERTYPAPPPPAEGDDGPAKARRDEWERARNAAIDQFRKERPAYMYRPYARIALRITRLAEQAQQLADESEQQKVWDSMVEYDPDNEPLKIPDFLDGFGIKDGKLREKACWTTSEIREHKRQKEAEQQQEWIRNALIASSSASMTRTQQGIQDVARRLDRVASTSEAALAAASDARDNATVAANYAGAVDDGLERVFSGRDRRKGR